MKYYVLWEIELEANNPHEAAQKALEIQRDSSSIALVFEVYTQTDDAAKEDFATSVDLSKGIGAIE